MSHFDAAAAIAGFNHGFRAIGNPVRAATEQRYLKSELAFHGTGVPAVHRAVSAFLRSNPALGRDDLLAVAAGLWATAVHECRAATVFLLDRRAALLEPSDIAFLESLLREAKTWALVDELATGPVCRLIARHPPAAEVLDRWAADPDLWVRRAALLALLLPLRAGEGDWERFTRYADAMLAEREFFIRKAIGWILRETGKKRPRLVADWLLPRASRASGVTVREAVRYLDPADHDAIMSAYRARTGSAAR